MQRTLQLTLFALAALSLGLTACTTKASDKSSASDEGTSSGESRPAVAAEEAMKSEQGVADAAFAALKANDSEAFAALMLPSAGMGKKLVDSLEPLKSGISEEELSEEDKVQFEKRFGFRPEDYIDADFPKFAKIVIQDSIFASLKDFEKRMATLPEHAKTSLHKRYGQRYEATLPDGAVVQVSVLKAENGRFCIGHFDVDHWKSRDGKKSGSEKTPETKTK